MSAKTTTFKIERTKSGRPAMWEQGGGSSNTGRATIVAGPSGEKLRPYYIRTRGSLACSDHALMPADVGNCIVVAYHHRRDFTVTVFRIEAVEDETVTASTVAKFERNEWDVEPTGGLAEAVQAAKSKATCYHCRTPHYIYIPPPPPPPPPGPDLLAEVESVREYTLISFDLPTGEWEVLRSGNKEDTIVCWRVRDGSGRSRSWRFPGMASAEILKLIAALTGWRPEQSE